MYHTRVLGMLFLAFATSAVVACGSRQARERGGEQWHGRIYPFVGDTGELATENSVANATMTRLPNRSVRATVTIRGGLAQGEYPWHVHNGTCGSGGAILGNPDEYPLLVPTPTEAMGNATATFEANLDPNGEYYVNVHRSEEEIGTIVACGQLQTD